MVLNSESPAFTPAPETLGEVETGERAEITGFRMVEELGDFLIRLQEVGFLVGEQVEVIGKAPIGKDPISVRVKDAVYAMRRDDANLILVKSVGRA